MSPDPRPTAAASEAAAATAKAAEETLARLADLARTALQGQVSVAKQSVALTRDTLSGDLDRTSAVKAYADAVTRESGRYWRAVGELGADYAADVIALGNRLSTTVLREVAEAGRADRGHGTKATTSSSQSGPSKQPGRSEQSKQPGRSTSSRTSDSSMSAVPDHAEGGRRVQVNLHGPVDGRAQGTITVANQHPRPRRIQLGAGDVVDSTGAIVAAATLDVTPARVTVPSGQERSVSLAIDLPKALFVAGDRYSAVVEVSGGDEATIDVTIDVGA